MEKNSLAENVSTISGQSVLGLLNLAMLAANDEEHEERRRMSLKTRLSDEGRESMP